MRIALLCCLLVWVPAVTARAPDPRIVRPIILELQGRFTTSREDAAAGGADAVTIRVGDRTRWFSATTARTLSDAPVSGRTVLSALTPIEPNLFARGGADLVHRLADTPDGVEVRMEGMVDRGSRTYLLRAVAVAAP